MAGVVAICAYFVVNIPTELLGQEKLFSASNLQMKKVARRNCFQFLLRGQVWTQYLLIIAIIFIY
jgi:hypothetical protein